MERLMRWRERWQEPDLISDAIKTININKEITNDFEVADPIDDTKKKVKEEAFKRSKKNDPNGETEAELLAEPNVEDLKTTKEEIDW